MDDARIRQLAEEVLAQLRAPGKETPPSDLESRVAALEAAVRALLVGAAPAAGPAAAAASATVVVAQVGPAPSHPAFGLLGPSAEGNSGRCVLEPGKPCVGSGQCRSFGY
jgi:hypothetical protein